MDGSVRDDSTRDDIHRQVMAMQPTEKVWRVPAYDGSGPVTMTVRIPDVTITDSEGRHIVISPRQAGLVSSHLNSISVWFQTAPEDPPVSRSC